MAVTPLLPDAPSLVVTPTRAVWVTTDGEIETLSHPELRTRLRTATPYVVHMRAAARRLNGDAFHAFDLLELFAFVRPGRFCPPTPRGLLLALDLDAPPDPEGQATLLPRAAERLLRQLADRGEREAASLLGAMAQAGWAWAAAAQAALGAVSPQGAHGFEVWRGLPEFIDQPPEPAGTHDPIAPEEARRRLASLVGAGAEARPSQADYASAVSHAFLPRDAPGAPQLVLAEAGTGVGKTLGYLSAASLWAERNKTAVWISTYTRQLQHQIDGELDRLHPDPAIKAQKIVIRKGRENYLCLLNYDEAAQAVRAGAGDPIGLGLMARWIAASRDGDLKGAGFPGWLPDLIGKARTIGLADHRGECIHAACTHYRRCFIERSIRGARQADIVVANHALVMITAALAGDDDGRVPARLVFDEGHHVFEAADNAFAATLSGAEGLELRRWLIGAEGGSRSRARGLRRRLDDLLAGQEAAQEQLDHLLRAARLLPGDLWADRLAGDTPAGPVEAFLATARRQILARVDRPDDPRGLEAALHPPVSGLPDAAESAAEALTALLTPARDLRRRLLLRLDDEAEELDTSQRQRIEAIARSLHRRAVLPVAAWIDMLRSVGADTPPEFVDWLSLDRFEGRESDVGLHRHWVDPTLPFARAVASGAHGVLVTSATLTDSNADPEAAWRAAEARTGTVHLPGPALRARVASPFDYARQTRCIVVTDVRKDDLAQVAAAYRTLFLAAGGGGLGLFTAIARLKEVHKRIAEPLDRAGIPLYAQHVDGLEVSSLVEVFRAEEDACLLGTDAVRDGVDVPGRALRLIVFDRVPWPRPDILHRARRERFGRAAYDDRLVRLRLRQAFGRLVRRAEDTGVFVLLDPMMPTRLADAFPPGVTVQRLGLKDALAEVRAFLGRAAAGGEGK